MLELDKVWGLTEGKCAWCLNADATKSYNDIDTTEELVEYQVCDLCYEEFAGEED